MTAILEDEERTSFSHENKRFYDGPGNDEKEDFLRGGSNKKEIDDKNSANKKDAAGGDEQGESSEKVERHKCLWVLWNDCSIADFISKSVSRNSLLGNLLILSNSSSRSSQSNIHCAIIKC